MAMLAVFGLVFGRATPAQAGQATDVVKAKQTALFDLLKANAADSKLQPLFDEMLDYSALAEASLGGEWAARSDAEKAQFADLLKQLVRKAYERNLRKVSAFNIDYVGEEPADGATLVKTMAKSSDPRDEPVEMNFKVAEKDGRWRVADIITEGVSLVGSYRTQFTKIIKKDGFPALIQKMKDKIAKGDVQ
jgi:phospholipid transport system substrate-binding protein